MSDAKTFWLSFGDGEKPDGEQFLGVAVVDVSVEEAADALEDIRTRFPKASPGAEWIAAATRKAWLMGCNPGGAVLCAEVPPEHAAVLPRNRLLTNEELERFGARDEP